MTKRTLHKGSTRFISVMLSVLLVVNTLELSAFAAEGTASTQQSVTVSGLSDPAQDPAEESNEQLPPDSEDKENEEQLEAPVEQDEVVSRDAAGAADDSAGSNTDDSTGSGDRAEMSAWASLQAEIDAAENDATITVAEDIKAESGDSALTIPRGKKITLQLNGTLDRGLDTETDDGSVIINYGDLTIIGGTITGGNTSGDGGGIYNQSGSLELNGVKICNNHAGDYGGAVYSKYGTIELIGGEISGNSAKMGGGFYVLGGEDAMTMSGGSIKANSAKNGAGIYVQEAEFLQSGGGINENHAGSLGGGVFLQYGTYKMTDGSISGNKTDDSGNGGGVYIEMGTFTMERGTINDNAARNGSAVYIAGDTFVLAGGTITGNESDGGAIVPAGSSSKFCIGGTNKINVTENMIPHGDEFNVYLKNDRLITVEAVPADGSQIGITTADLPVAGTNVQNYVKFADVSAGVSAARAAGAFSSDAGFEVYDVDSSLYLRYNRIATWSELQDALDNGGEAEMVPPDDPNGDWDWIHIIRLTDDLTAGSGDLALHFHHNFDDDEIILDLRGHSIDRGLAGLNSFQSDGYVLHMDGGKLIIRDSVGGGAIKGGNSDYAGGVYVENGTLTLESGAITGNRAYDGGGVYIRDGELRQTGGSISDNSATEGGGVYIGGGVLQQTGGSISGNTALEGGGIFVQNSDTYRISGTPVVTDNTDEHGEQSNIYLFGQATISVTDELSDGAKLGISSDSAHPVTSGYANYCDGEDPVGRYFFDDYLYYLYFDQNSEEVSGEVSHDMQPIWTWPEEDDGTQVTLEMKCGNCGETGWSETADIGGPGAYSDEEGGFGFTAEVTHDGETYSDTKYVAPEYVETAEPFMDGGGSLRNGMKEHYKLKYGGITYYYPVDGERPGEGPVDPADFILEAYVVHLDPDNGTDESGIMICSGTCTLPSYEDVQFKVPVGTAFHGWKDESGNEYGPGTPVDLTSKEATFTAVWSSEWALVNSALQSGEEITLRNDITAEADDTALTVPFGVTASLNFNGFKADRGLTGPVEDGYVIRVDGKLNMSGGSAKGLITGGYNSGDGGGIFVAETGSVDITDVDIKSNHSSNGAGLYLTLGGAAVLAGSAVMYNIASAKGGGAFVSKTANLFVNQSTQIVENVAQEGAGVYIKTGGTSTYTGPDVKVKNNTNPKGDFNNIQPETVVGEIPVVISGSATGMFLGFTLYSFDDIATFIAGLTISTTILNILQHIIFDTSNKNDKKDQEEGCDHPSRSASWDWNANFTQANAALICNKCGQPIEASDNDPQKSVDSDGVTTYTAHVHHKDQEFVDKKTVPPYIVTLKPGNRCHVEPVIKRVPHDKNRSGICKLDLPANFNPEGLYIASMWSDDATQEVYPIDSVIDVDKDMTFTMIWANGVQVTYKKGVNDPPENDFKVLTEYDKDYEFLPCMFKRENYGFTKWKIIEGGVIDQGINKLPGEKIKARVSIDAIAQWQSKWSLLGDRMNDPRENTIVIDLEENVTAQEDDKELVVPFGKTVKLNMNGHTLDRNLTAASEDGCVIRVKGTLILNGPGTLKGGFSTGGASGIILENTGGLKISGALNITDNRMTVGGNTSSRNVYVPANAKIEVTGALEDAKIGITTQKKPEAGSPVIFTDGLRSYGGKDNFVSDDSSYKVGLNENGEAVLEIPTVLINGVTGSFNDKIKLNYYFNIPDEVLADKEAYVTLTNDSTKASLKLLIKDAEKVKDKG